MSPHSSTACLKFCFILLVLNVIGTCTSPVVPSSPVCTAAANYCTDVRTDFSENGRVRVGPDYVSHFNCSLPGGTAVWIFDNRFVVLRKASSGVLVPVAESTLTIQFAFEEESYGCVTTSATITRTGQSISSELSLELICTDQLPESSGSAGITIPVTVEVVQGNPSIPVEVTPICHGVFNLTWDKPKEWMCHQDIVYYNVSAVSSQTGQIIFADSTTLTHYVASKMPDNEIYDFIVTPVSSNSSSNEVTVKESSAISSSLCTPNIVSSDSPGPSPSQSERQSVSTQTPLPPTSRGRVVGTTIGIAAGVVLPVVIIIIAVFVILLIAIFKRERRKDLEKYEHPEDKE